MRCAVQPKEKEFTERFQKVEELLYYLTDYVIRIREEKKIIVSLQEKDEENGQRQQANIEPL